VRGEVRGPPQQFVRRQCRTIFIVEHGP
jgi:hypothetical protein